MPDLAVNKRIERRSTALAAHAQTQESLLESIYLARETDTRGARKLGNQDLHTPQEFLGMERAVEVIFRHLRRSIVIVGDYDADGATSTALMMLALRSMGAVSVSYTVPDRFNEGYGLSKAIVERLADQAPTLIITVDNGISSFEGVDSAHAHGIEVVITDHHLPGASLPDAEAIVNPNQPNCGFPGKDSAGVGVVFYLMSRLKQHLISIGHFDSLGMVPPNLAQWLDLVALGTYADLVKLDQNNRILVYQGLQRIRAGRCRPGIKALIEVAGRSLESLSESDFGFLIAPRLNAAGRLDDMSIGIECLLTDSELSASQAALQLDELNRSRREIEAKMKVEADNMMRSLQSDIDNSSSEQRGICLYKDSWHEGVVGILASRVKEQTGKPCFMFASESGGEEVQFLKGSGRSIAGIHLRDLLESIASKSPGLIERFGGHAMAAGLTIRRQALEKFEQLFAEQLQSRFDADIFQSSIISDAELSGDLINIETALAIENGGPWGQGFPLPIFDGVFEVIDRRVLKGLHLKLILRSAAGQEVDAIAFNSPWTEKPMPSKVRLAYTLDVNRFRGRSNVQLNVQYIEVA